MNNVYENVNSVYEGRVMAGMGETVTTSMSSLAPSAPAQGLGGGRRGYGGLVDSALRPGRTPGHRQHSWARSRLWLAIVSVVACLSSLVSVGTGAEGATVVESVPAGSAVGANADLQLGIGGESAALWLLKSVGAGVIGAAAGKGFNEILSLLIEDKTSAQLDQIKAKLDEIKVQLDELQRTMDAALGEIEKTQQAVLAQPIIALQTEVDGAEGDFLEAMSYAGQPGKKFVIANLIDKMKKAVDNPKGLADSFPTSIPGAIMPSAFISKPFYQALSNVMTTSKRVFTWRDSAGLDNVFQYLLYLQALQFNLVAQVRTMEGSSADQIYLRFLQPYVGSKTSFQDFLDGKIAAPASGSLHDELAAQLQRVPNGAVIDTKGNSLWAVDVPGGAQEWGLGPSGPGYPTCTTAIKEPNPVWVWCLTKPSALPNTMKTSTFDCCTVAPTVASVATRLKDAGYGKAEDWQLPTMADWRALVAGSTGTPKSWLEAQSGVDPNTCKQVGIASTQVLTDPNTCIWPSLGYWSSTWEEIADQVSQDYQPYDTARNYLYGFRFRFFDATQEGGQGQGICYLFTKKTDASDLRNVSPVVRNWPDTKGCGGDMILYRKLTSSDRYYFSL